MLQSRFLQLFAGLDDQEVKAFHKFIYSPFFDVRAQSREFFEYLKKTRKKWYPLYHEWKAERDPEKRIQLREKLNCYLCKEEVSMKLFPGELYNDDRMRRVIYNGRQHLIAYILQTGPRSGREEYVESIGLLRYHLDRGEYEQLEARLAEYKKKRVKAQVRDHSFYYYSFQLEEIENDFLIRAGRREFTYPLMMEHLDTFFVLYKLRMFCSMISIEKQIGTTFRLSMLEELSAYIQANNFLKEPLVKIYFFILEMERGKGTETHYQKLLSLVVEHGNRISLSEMRQIHGFIYNYLQREHRKPGVNKLPEIFQLLLRMVEETTLYSNGLITQSYFKVCVEVAGKVGEWEWAEDFIYANEELIAGENSREIFDFGLLTLLFYKKEYGQILKHIDELVLENAHNQVKRRILKIKCYYELGQSIAFFYQCENLKKSLSVSIEKVGPTGMQFYGNFRFHAERLGRCKFDLKEVSKKVVEELKTRPAAEQEWLDEKVEELMNLKSGLL